MSNTTSFTTACFEASHRGEYANEVHGHLWFVSIGWPGEPQINVCTMNKRLTACLDQWDHKMLDGLVEPTNEGIAAAIRKQIAGLSEVEVWRGGRVPSRARWINKTEKEVVTGTPQSIDKEMGGGGRDVPSRSLNQYRHTFVVVCPNNGVSINYDLLIETATKIMVEDIVAACRVKSAYHEDLADALFTQFGGRQEMRAFHHGVHITTNRGSL